MTPTIATWHPSWCDPRHCATDAAGIVWHSCSPVACHLDSDAELTMRRVWVDEAGAEIKFELAVHDLTYGDKAKLTLGEADATMLCAMFAWLRDLTNG